MNNAPPHRAGTIKELYSIGLDVLFLKYWEYFHMLNFFLTQSPLLFIITYESIKKWSHYNSDINSHQFTNIMIYEVKEDVNVK